MSVKKYINYINSYIIIIDIFPHRYRCPYSHQWDFNILVRIRALKFKYVLYYAILLINMKQLCTTKFIFYAHVPTLKSKRIKSKQTELPIK